MVRPRNMGELPGAHGIGEVTGPECGDKMTLFIQVAEGRIIEARFKTFGCWAAIGAGSLVTEMIKGMTPEDAVQVSLKELAEDLQGLPGDKEPCVLLVIQALREAIADYRGGSAA